MPDIHNPVSDDEMTNLLDSAFPSIGDVIDPPPAEPEEDEESEEGEEGAGSTDSTEEEDPAGATSIAKELYKQMRDDLIGPGQQEQPQQYRNPVLDIPDDDLTVEQLVAKTQVKAAEYVGVVLSSRTTIENIFKDYEVSPEVRANIDNWIASTAPGDLSMAAVESAAYYALGQGLSTGKVKPKVAVQAPPVTKKVRSAGSGIPAMSASASATATKGSPSAASSEEAAFRKTFGSDFTEEEISSMFGR